METSPFLQMCQTVSLQSHSSFDGTSNFLNLTPNFVKVSKKKKFFSIFQWRWAAHTPPTRAGAGAAVEPALDRDAQQRAAPLLPPHGPNIRLRLLYRRRDTGDRAEQTAGLFGASHRGRASPRHVSYFLQWTHTQRHRVVGPGR